MLGTKLPFQNTIQKLFTSQCRKDPHNTGILSITDFLPVCEVTAVELGAEQVMMQQNGCVPTNNWKDLENAPFYSLFYKFTRNVI